MEKRLLCDKCSKTPTENQSFYRARYESQVCHICILKILLSVDPARQEREILKKYTLSSNFITKNGHIIMIVALSPLCDLHTA